MIRINSNLRKTYEQVRHSVQSHTNDTDEDVGVPGSDEVPVAFLARGGSLFSRRASLAVDSNSFELAQAKPFCTDDSNEFESTHSTYS